MKSPHLWRNEKIWPIGKIGKPQKMLFPKPAGLSGKASPF
jgi:hypothetical protein